MILLNKKRMVLILLSITISIFSTTIYPYYLPVNSLPVTNHTVIIDAGHGLPDGGAIGIRGTIESNINLSICLKLQNLLEASNCSVILTRSDENGIYDISSKTIKDKKISDMRNRVKISEDVQSDAFISIHMNKIDISKYSGWQTFYKASSESSQILASNIQNNLNQYIDKENNRKIKPISDIYLSKHIKIPFVLIECGFLSNPEENNLLQTNKYQDTLAWCIYTGIMDYFKNI